MTIEIFSKEQFEQVLTDNNLKFDDRGWISDERVYIVKLDSQSGIMIRSSIHPNNVSAEDGKDSIRLWLVGADNQTILASKEIANQGRWVTRQPGWDKRLISAIERLRTFRIFLGNCFICNSPRMALVSHTAKNPNRPFTKCSKCGEWGAWFDTNKVEKQMPLQEYFDNLHAVDIDDQHQYGDPLQTGADKSKSEKKTNNDKDLSVPICNDGPASFLSNEPAAIILPQDKVEPAPVKEFTPSRYQKDFYSALQGDDNIVLIAGPGTGKTTTIKHAAPYLPSKAKVVAVAFNKKNAADLASVMPDWVQCQTLHSLGLKAITKAWGHVQVEDRKTYNILRDYQDHTVQDNAPAINQLVSLCKNTLTEPEPENLDRLCNYYGVDVNGDSGLIYRTVKSVFEEGRQKRNIVDFDDMIYYPGSGQVPCEKFDRVLIDELQDLNNAQIQQCMRSIVGDGHIYGLGDPRQSLYGFRAADVDAVEKVTKALNAKTLPLSISYRLPVSHVKQLNQLFPDAHIEARDNAPEGIIADLPSNKLFEKVKAGDMVVCRTNAPLIEPCFELIRRGIKATIAGRDIGKNLVTLIHKMQKKSGTSDLHTILMHLQSHISIEIPKLIFQHKENQALSLQDSAETIFALSENCNTIADIDRKIANVFSDNVQGVVFSSIHRCKGLEADQVFLLHRELIPHPLSKQPWQIKQEKNCLFVALSRSKNALYYVR